jgi:hypothetical protein
MSQTLTKIGFGIALSHSSTIGGSYTAVAEVLEITPPMEQVDEVKVYRSDNTAAVVERIPGWQEVGDLDLTITYISGTRATLEGFLGVPGYWKVTYPLTGTQASAGDVDLFYGFLKELSKDTPIKDAMKVKAKICVSGALSFIAGS